MKLPLDLSGHDLALALARFGYVVTRQTGSHMQLTSKIKDGKHHGAIPAHDPLRVGTLSQILGDVATYLETSREELGKALFE